MDSPKIETTVNKILADVLGITPNEITLDSTFVNLGADSFDELDIMVQIEKNLILK